MAESQAAGSDAGMWRALFSTPSTAINLASFLANCLLVYLHQTMKLSRGWSRLPAPAVAG
ncbi:hypothetical protein P175DRAFT_0502566 [Aspergillus ochraceoroseus IBT 24754]|uniref:Uncharacterized protein n=1 Tax=Aspergillus ochraceoroseus IBT 24754 TaxID=1392256 RepID=A0A2T5LVX4_9EURO|nr:uncharacterized protein P175DRAFT_0502566 [Aspergillus ochraceoroseus IBT 24754]PTU20444.1 hypothetical protein P175DRAFT_0502566 [Aspergillus ochraceoroseus IBT 24754]